MKNEKFDPNIIEIDILGMKKKVDLREALITKNVTPIELNKKLSTLPAMYSYYGALRVKLDSVIDEKTEDFERWLAKAISKLEGKFTSEKAREREIRSDKVLGVKYDKMKKELRELNYYRGIAEIMRKGYNQQFFTIKEQTNLILQEKTDTSISSETKKVFNKRR